MCLCLDLSSSCLLPGLFRLRTDDLLSDQKALFWFAIFCFVLRPGWMEVAARTGTGYFLFKGTRLLSLVSHTTLKGKLGYPFARTITAGRVKRKFALPLKALFHIPSSL